MSTEPAPRSVKLTVRMTRGLWRLKRSFLREWMSFKNGKHGKQTILAPEVPDLLLVSAVTARS